MAYKLLKHHYINKEGEIRNRRKDSYKKWWHRNLFRITNSYLRNFYYRGVAKHIRQFPKRNRIFKNRGSFKRDKEITEAYAVINAMKKHNIEPNVVFDIGSGVGFFTQINSVKHPKSFTYAIDVNSKMRTTQFEDMPNAMFTLIDIYSEGFDQWISGIKHPITLVGVHLCFDLSPRLIELFNKHPNITNMVLLPCCFKGGDYQGYLEKLLHLIEVDEKYLYIDKKILSVKDGVIVAKRK